MAVTGQALVAKMDELLGWTYSFGGELNGTAPGDCDCSEAVEWSCRNLGVSPKMPDGSGNQFNHCDSHGLRISIDQARNTPGSLIFKSHTSAYPPGDRNNGGIYHVAVVKSWNTTTEVCCGDGDRIKNMSIDGRSWYGWAGLAPGVTYDGSAPPTTPPPPSDDSWDSGMRNLYETDPRMKGDDVKACQFLLLDWGFVVGGGADGVFGPGTAQAVREFQASRGLTVDGNYGSASRKKANGG